MRTSSLPLTLCLRECGLHPEMPSVAPAGPPAHHHWNTTVTANNRTSRNARNSRTTATSRSSTTGRNAAGARTSRTGSSGRQTTSAVDPSASRSSSTGRNAAGARTSRTRAATASTTQPTKAAVNQSAGNRATETKASANNAAKKAPASKDGRGNSSTTRRPPHSGQKQSQKQSRTQGKPQGPATSVVGTFRSHPRGFGFLDVVGPDGTEGVFVPPPSARNLLDGDTVTAKVRADERGATVEKVVNVARNRSFAAGTIAADGTLRLHPTLGAGTLTRGQATGKNSKTPAGHLAVVALPKGRTGSYDTVIAAAPAGSVDAARLVATCRAYGDIPSDMPDGTDRATLHAWTSALLTGTPVPTPSNDTATSLPVPGASLTRRDLTGLATVTIDGPTTRDIDDAISASTSADGRIRMHVHTADVAAAVPAGSALDRHARTVATSVYLPDRTVPMLPVELSEGSLSLLPNQHRDTLTVAFTVAASGAVDDVEVSTSRIVSDAQLTYEQVQRRIDGSDTIGGTGSVAKKVAATVDAAATAARYLAGERGGRTTFERLFTSPVSAVSTLDGTVQVSAADPFPDAQMLIERLMVAANEAVACWLDDADVPALYRTHVGIDPERTELLSSALAAAGVTPDTLDAAGLAGALGDAPQRHLAQLETVAAFAFARAVYSTSPTTHVGLDSKPYTHFTSPIRRYADLAVHRAIRAVLAGEQAPESAVELDALAVWITDRSGASARAEAGMRELLWSLALLAAGSGEALGARVCKLIPAGALIRLDASGVSGFLPAEELLGAGKLELSANTLSSRCGKVTVGSVRSVKAGRLDPSGRVTFSAAA